MNENQMAFRCPDAQVVGTVRLEGYRLTFAGNGGGRGVATILPEKGSYVDGVLWRISGGSPQGTNNIWTATKDFRFSMVRKRYRFELPMGNRSPSWPTP